MKSVLTPLDFLARSAVVYRSCPAVVDGDRRLTYAEFQQRVHAFASALQHAGIAPGIALPCWRATACWPWKLTSPCR